MLIALLGILGHKDGVAFPFQDCFAQGQSHLTVIYTEDDRPIKPLPMFRTVQANRSGQTGAEHNAARVNMCAIPLVSYDSGRWGTRHGSTSWISKQKPRPSGARTGHPNEIGWATSQASDGVPRKGIPVKPSYTAKPESVHPAHS